MRRLTIALLGALFVLDLYRGATQSIVHDEALTWQMYLATPWTAFFQIYDANNHFLHTFLLKLVTGFFGYSEFAMRIPALAAAALLLWSTFRLGRLVVGETWLLPLFAVVVAANPLVLDFQVAARGYGMGLALLVFALERMLCYVQSDRRPQLLWHAAVGLSLAVMANLIYVVPAAVAAVAFARTAPKKPSLYRYFWLPIGVLALLFLMVIPVADMHKDNFYVGLTNVPDSLEMLGRQMVAHNDGWGRINAFTTLQYRSAQVLGWLLLPLATAAGLWFGWRGKTRPALWFASVIVAGSWVALILLHYLAGLLLPDDRTGLYLFPLWGFLLVALAARLPGWGRWAPALLAVVLAGWYLVQINWTQFMGWRYDADTRAFLEEIRRENPGRNVRIGVSWQLEPSTQFYRTTRSWTWYETDSREALQPGLDVYLLLAQDRDKLAALNLEAVRTGDVSGTILARPKR